MSLSREHNNSIVRPIFGVSPSNSFIITFTNAFTLFPALPDQSGTNKIEIAKLVQFSVSLLLNVPILALLLSRKTLRSKKTNQLFVNVILSHITFAVAGITWEILFIQV